MLTPRDRVYTALAHQRPDRVPCSDDFWIDTLARFRREGLPSDADLADFFAFDIDSIFLDASPRLPERLIEETDDQITFTAKHGFSAVKWKNKSGALHYFDHASVTREGWEQIRKRFVVEIDGTARISDKSYFDAFVTWPTWHEAVQQCRRVAKRGRFVLMVFYGPVEATWRHHGYTELCMDMAENPDWVAEMFNVYADLACATLDKGIAEGIRPDGILLIEDLGTTQATLMSPEDYRRFIKPAHARIFETARRHGLSRFIHSDGRIHAILDDLVEIGVQALNPIDTGSGMDPMELRRRYGKRLTLYGGVSARDMPDAVKSNAQIDAMLPAVAGQGGYIFHSDHSVGPDVSLQRYQAILARVRAFQ